MSFKFIQTGVLFKSYYNSLLLVSWQENLQEVCDALSYSSISVDIIPSTEEAACIQQLFFHKLCACQLCLLPGSTGAVPVGPHSHFCDC